MLEDVTLDASMGPPRFELGSPAPKAGRITRLPYGPFSETKLKRFKKFA